MLDYLTIMSTKCPNVVSLIQTSWTTVLPRGSCAVKAYVVTWMACWKNELIGSLGMKNRRSVTHEINIPQRRPTSSSPQFLTLPANFSSQDFGYRMLGTIHAFFFFRRTRYNCQSPLRHHTQHNTFGKVTPQSSVFSAG